MMNQLKTAFWMVLLTVLLVLIGRVWLGNSGMFLFLGVALVMNGVAYWFSDRIALAAAQAQEVGPAEAPMLHRLATTFAADRALLKVSATDLRAARQDVRAVLVVLRKQASA